MLDWVARLADDLLAAAIASYADTGVDAPPSRLTFGSIPALECPLLAVSVISLEARSPIGTPGTRCAVVPRVRLAVWVARCYPAMHEDGSGPSADEETAAVTTLDTDLSILWDGLLGLWAQGKLFPSFPGLDCEAVSVGVAVPSGPLGGVAAWMIPVTADVLAVR